MGFPTRRIPRYFRRIGLFLAATFASVAIGWSHPATVDANSTVDGALFNLLNQDRAAAGLAPLQWSSALGGIAEAASYGGCGFTVFGRAQDMLQRNYFSHTILNCGSQTVFNMMRANGISLSSAGENISFVSGLTSAGAIAQYLNTSFMNSLEHRGNILNAAYTQVGVGTAYGSTWSGACSGCHTVTIGVEDFAAGRTASSPPPPRHASPPAANPGPPRPAPVAAPAAAPATPPPPPVVVLSPSRLIHTHQPSTGAVAPSRSFPAPRALSRGQPPQPWLPIGALAGAGGLAWWRLSTRSNAWQRAAPMIRRGST